MIIQTFSYPYAGISFLSLKTNQQKKSPFSNDSLRQRIYAGVKNVPFSPKEKKNPVLP
jgi:hypothetical protein